MNLEASRNALFSWRFHASVRILNSVAYLRSSRPRARVVRRGPRQWSHTLITLLVIGVLATLYRAFWIGGKAIKEFDATARRLAEKRKQEELRQAREDAERVNRPRPPPSRHEINSIGLRVERWTNPMGRDLLMLYVDWTNGGNQPIRKLKGIIRIYDADGFELPCGTGGSSYLVYSEFAEDPGIAPGESYRAPKGKGFILFPTGREPKSAGFEVTEVSDVGF